jgi:hypothetical protein
MTIPGGKKKIIFYQVSRKDFVTYNLLFFFFIKIKYYIYIYIMYILQEITIFYQHYCSSADIKITI